MCVDLLFVSEINICHLLNPVHCNQRQKNNLPPNRSRQLLSQTHLWCYLPKMVSPWFPTYTVCVSVCVCTCKNVNRDKRVSIQVRVYRYTMQKQVPRNLTNLFSFRLNSMYLCLKIARRPTLGINSLIMSSFKYWNANRFTCSSATRTKQQDNSSID